MIIERPHVSHSTPVQEQVMDVNMKNTRSARAACWAAILFVLSATLLSAQTFKTLVDFNGPDGADPAGSLVQGLDGNLYGTTYSGGPYGKDDFGTIFRINASGERSGSYDFCPQPQNGCVDGDGPYSGLVLGTDGNFYGTAVYGGFTGVGTIFKLSGQGAVTTLYSFCPGGLPHCIDGMNPHFGLIQGADGNFYGTTETGGANCFNSLSDGCGTVFRVTPTGEMTTLYSFCSQSNCTDGLYPDGGLVQGADGNFYGTTMSGGTDKDLGLGGTLFKITPSGRLTTIYNFCQQLSCTDGQSPSGELVQGTDGNFYGTTQVGGAPSYGGTIFKITPAGSLTTLYRFCKSTRSGADISPILPYECYDGSTPVAGLTLGSDGNFYGTTYSGGFVKDAQKNCNGNCGTVFKITPQGQFKTLHRFKGGDGNEPVGGLLQATNGKIYGTTYLGGTFCIYCGTVFQIGLSLKPFVLANPGFGKPGRVIQILGDQLAETSAVTFNCTPAQFEIVSDTHIKATVPDGATTGTIQVTTPSGTLNSNVAFHVLP